MILQPDRFKTGANALRPDSWRALRFRAQRLSRVEIRALAIMQRLHNAQVLHDSAYPHESAGVVDV